MCVSCAAEQTIWKRYRGQGVLFILVCIKSLLSKIDDKRGKIMCGFGGLFEGKLKMQVP